MLADNRLGFQTDGRDRDRSLQIVEGENNLLIFGEGLAKDIHCNRCGSLLYSLVRDGEYAHVPLGTLNDDPTIRSRHHIFDGSKAPWFVISDVLPQFDAFD